MRKRLILLIVFIIGAISSAQEVTDSPISPDAIPSWKQLGPAGGNIIDLAANPKNKSEIYSLISSYPGQIFMTSNAGQSWKRVTSLTAWLCGFAIDPSNPNTLYTNSDSGIYKSVNKGVGWNHYFFPNGFWGYGKMAVNPLNPKILFVAGYYQSSDKSCMALVKSINSGVNWTIQKFVSSSSWGEITGVVISPSNPNTLFILGNIYEGNRWIYKIYRSTNGGNTWQDVSPSISDALLDIAVDHTNPNKVYLGTAWGIYRSSDGGQTWQKNSGFAYASALAIDPSNPSIIYGGYTNDIYRSVDGGANWTSYSDVLYGDCQKLLVSNPVCAGTTAGFHQSADGGANWSFTNSGLRATNIPSVTVAPSSPNILYAEAKSNAFLKSTNYGAIWDRMPYFYRCDAINSILVNPINANDIFILAGG